MKKSIVFILMLSSLFFLQCRSPEENKITKVFQTGRFDVDSSLTISYPVYLDSLSYLEYPSYEYKYYLKLSSRDKKEEMLIQRLKFKGETLNKNERIENFINGVKTDIGYKEVRLLRKDEKTVNGKNIVNLLFSANSNKGVFYPSINFFYNPDSSFTVIEMKMRSSDSTMALKESDYILNSIGFVDK